MKGHMVGLVLRHGETQLNNQNCYRSWLDVPLDDNGLRQAEEAAEFLKKYPIRNVICSPLLRAFVTAITVAKKHDLFVAQHRGLFPWRLGVFSGKPRSECDKALALFVKHPEVCIPEGESLHDFEDRQFAFWEAALKLAKTDGLTLYVAHTSNVVALENFTSEQETSGEPEMGSESVKPGGIAAIYWDGKTHRVEPVFGTPEKAKFGGS